VTAPIERLSRSLGFAPPFSPRTLECVTRRGTYSIDKVARVVGWTPKVALDAGMERTHLWLVETGLVPVQPSTS
jgi:2-alkyl-3-oxoalkanoate reductase